MCKDKDYTFEQRIMIRLLFGDDNLTSDAEGEEMLTVPRKKVLYMYDFNEDILICDPTHNGAKLLKAKLQELFGSKCLPDEACNVASSDVASSKPKPTEPKFKRCKKVITPSGEVCIIEDTYFENGCWLCLVGDPARWIPESDLEPYTEPKENVNLSQDSANCDKEFDNIPKDSFSKERRLNIAVQMVKAITQCPESQKGLQVRKQTLCSMILWMMRFISLTDSYRSARKEVSNEHLQTDCGFDSGFDTDGRILHWSSRFANAESPAIPMGHNFQWRIGVGRADRNNLYMDRQT